MSTKVIWSAQLTSDMVKGLSDEELGDLICALDDAVAQTCEQWGDAIG